MKATLLAPAIFLLAHCTLIAQPVFTPSKPALVPASSFVPGSPALTGLTPALTPSVAAGTPTNLTVTEVAATLSNLQFTVQTALPVVSSFNDAVDATRTAASAGAPSLNNPGIRDTVRAMIVLQTDLERSVALLAALNGSVINGTGQITNAVGNLAPGNLTNVFGP